MTEQRKLITEEQWSWGASRYCWNDLEPAPPKDWKEQMYELELRNARLSRFILDWLGRELDIFPEGALSLSDILPVTGRKLEE